MVHLCQAPTLTFSTADRSQASQRFCQGMEDQVQQRAPLCGLALRPRPLSPRLLCLSYRRRARKRSSRNGGMSEQLFRMSLL